MELRDCDIKFSGLGLGEHSFEFHLNVEFFSLFDYSDFEDATITVNVALEKKTNRLDLIMELNGNVRIPCDVSSDMYNQEIEANSKLLVKFGEEYDDTIEDILILNYGEHTLNLAQYFYEMAVLAVPLKRLSPETIKKLEEEGDKPEEMNLADETEETTDPRWDKLKNLLN